MQEQEEGQTVQDSESIAVFILDEVHNTGCTVQHVHFHTKLWCTTAATSIETKRGELQRQQEHQE